MAEPTLSGDIRKKSRVTALEERLYKTNEDAVLLEERVAAVAKYCADNECRWGMVRERVDSHRQTLAKQAGNAMDLEQRVAVLEHGLFNALTERVARLEESIQSLCLALDYEQLIEPRGPHD